MSAKPSDEMKPLLARLATGAWLTRAEADTAFRILMDGEASDGQIGAFLMGLRQRGETVEEIAAGVRAMRARMLQVKAPAGAIDTCGTGGDAKGTYNISTTVAFVLAGAGVPVAKHGNRALSSKSGAADVLQALGVEIELSPHAIETALQQVGVAFLFAPAHHSAMAHVGPVRAALGTRTIFNLLGPLANPASVKRQLVGVFAREWVRPIAEALKDLGCERALIVHGEDGLDELTVTGTTHMARLDGGTITEETFTPEAAGLPRAKLDALIGGTAADNALALRAVLGGEPGAYRDMVLLNSAGALWVAGRCDTIADGVALAARSIDDGKALEKLDALAAFTRSVSA